jgi:capsular polysaccharide biosynthesis protein
VGLVAAGGSKLILSADIEIILASKLPVFIRLLPLINTGLRRLGRNVNPEKMAAETVVVSPEETQPILKPIFLPNQIGKITARAPGIGTLQEEIDLAFQSRQVHAPLIRYTLRNCFVHEAGFEVLGGARRKKEVSGWKFLKDPVLSIPDATYCMTSVSHTYFGHWLLDSCATALLARPEQALLLDPRPDWSHSAQYLNVFGLRPATPAQYVVDRLVFYQDHALGASKRDRWKEMRRRILEAIPDAAGSSELIYFRRGNTGVNRSVANEPELLSALSRQGFSIVEVDGPSVSQIQQSFRTARIVISMEGSHQHHLYFSMPPGSCLITITPADRFALLQLRYANATELRFAFVVASPTENGYEVDIPDLLRTIDLVS